MLSAFASLMMLYIVLAPAEEVRTPQEEESGISAYEIATAGRKDIKELSAKATHTEPEITSDFTEEITEEFNCLMYATIPIGRYYITAYNHEETGSKITASGKTCHEGTITTCAIDPKLHRFDLKTHTNESCEEEHTAIAIAIRALEARPQGECCDSCYLCDVGNCDVKMQKGGTE